ncbi:hypothetical protein PO909_019620 [Leuciscus waleckii]
MGVFWRWFWCLIWFGVSANRAGSPVFSDEIPFKIKWPGSDFTLGDVKEYSGPSPAMLLEPLFKQSSCSYRIESYWTYEVCHGKHVRQYHEEKETGQVPTKNIEGQLTPYFPVEMGHGTECSVRQNEPRTTTVLYVCHPEAKHEILTIAEVVSCQYEVVVLTPLLCPHPNYRFKSSPVNDIFCQALGGSPLRPQSLSQLDREQEEMLKPPFSSSIERDLRGSREDKPPVKEEAYTSTHKPLTVGGQAQVTVGTTHISRLTDEQLIKEFLSGSYCLHGGVGWWKYEFCYGKHVHQYHEDKEQGKNIVVVGSWNTEDHMNWAKKNVARSYYLKDDGVQKVKIVSHFYGHGDVCDLTGKPRQVVVKLKCKESDSPHAVTVYMLEPQTCQYILGVESPVICKILDTADENGFLSIPS